MNEELPEETKEFIASLPRMGDTQIICTALTIVLARLNALAKDHQNIPTNALMAELEIRSKPYQKGGR